MVEELLQRTVLDGAAVTAVRAIEADAADDWSAILGLARGGLLGFPGIAAAPTEALAAFSTRLPEWRERFSGIGEAAPAGLSHALTEVLRCAAEEQPVVMSVDNAQWLDPESLAALAVSLRNLARSPVMLTLTTTGYPPRTDLDELESRISRDIPGAVVCLRPLGSEDLRALARWWLPGFSEIDIERVSRRVATDSAGVPLLASELFRAVAGGLDLGGDRAVWPEPFRTLDQTLPADLPEIIVAAIRVGFRRLSPPAQEVLAAAAVLEDRVPPETLVRATGRDPPTVDAALDELEWTRWLVSEVRGYSFVARIVREVVARDMLTEGQRRRVRERGG